MSSRPNRRQWLLSAAGLSALSMAGVPLWALAASPAPAPALFAKTPRIEKIDLAPDASKIAYVTQEAGQRILLILDLTSKAVKKLPMGDYKLRSMFWAGPEHIVFETSVTRPIQVTSWVDEYYQAHVLNIITGKTFTLFDVEGYHDIVLGGLDVYKQDGKYLISGANISPTTDAVTLFSFDMTSPSGDFLDGGREGTAGWVVTPEGKILGRENYDFAGVTRTDWTLEMFIGRKWVEIYRKTIVTDSPSLIGIGRDGQSLVISLSEEGQGSTYHEIDAHGVVSEPLFNGDGTRFPLFHPMTRRLCGYRESGIWPTYHYDDSIMAGVFTALGEMVEPGERVKPISYAEDPQKVILYTEGAGNAGSYFYSDFTTGDVVPILQNYPDIDAEWISDKKPISYLAADGLKITALITYPPFKDPKNLPLVVLVHGGPLGIYDTLNFEWEAQVYASQGYVVLQPNYRGSGGRGWDFMAKGFGEYGRKMQTDLSDGVRQLVKLGIVDPKRVAISGASYGGYAALMGAAVDRGVYRCAIDVAGVSDPEFFYLHTNLKENSSYRWAKRMLGDGNLDEISPLKNADKVDIPILIIHGDDDTVVSKEESERMVAALKKAGKDVTFVRLGKEDHWQTTQAGRTTMINAIVPFLQKYNPS